MASLSPDLAAHTRAPLAAGAVAWVYGDFLLDMLSVTSAFDVLTWHCYAGYKSGDFVEPCLAQYDYASGLFHKVILSETSVVCYDCDLVGHDRAQVEHFIALEHGLPVLWIWYTGYFNGWMHTDMLGRDEYRVLYARPVYDELVRYYGR